MISLPWHSKVGISPTSSAVIYLVTTIRGRQPHLIKPLGKKPFRTGCCYTPVPQLLPALRGTTILRASSERTCKHSGRLWSLHSVSSIEVRRLVSGANYLFFVTISHLTLCQLSRPASSKTVNLPKVCPVKSFLIILRVSISIRY